MPTLIPSEQATKTANRNGSAQYDLYTITPGAFVFTWDVTNRETGNGYTVDTFTKSCDCKAFENGGICKHQVIVELTEQENAMYDAMAPDTEAFFTGTPDY
jgi:hypothetical protein